MSREEKPSAAFALALASGLLVLAGSLVMTWFAATWVAYAPAVCPMCGRGAMMWVTWFPPMLGLISGALILIGAIMLYSRPEQSLAWGLVVLVFSVLSLFAGGGFLVGAVLGLVAGILALTWRPPSGPAPSQAAPA
ncbi:MAG: hypothetical protein C4339_06110 [Nitrososphaerota archaeon]